MYFMLLRRRKLKIYDCFTFFNELELLDLRLMVLSDYVDYFVLVEADTTHTGKPKEFIFENNKDMFSDYLDKIIHIKVTDLPKYSKVNIWPAENFQRLCIERGLAEAEEGDKIIVSDADEISNPETILKHLDHKAPVALQQKLFYYYVNCFQNQPWSAPVLLTRGHYSSVQEDRLTAFYSKNPVSNGGWHYSYMGGPEKIRLKVENIAESHVIIDKVGDISTIEKKMKNQKDLWGRADAESQKWLIDIHEEGMAPRCIDRFIAKYPEFYFNNES